MKKKEAIITTVAHNRKGDNIVLKNLAGNIEIIGKSGQNQKRANLIEIEVTGTASVHDYINIRASKGTVEISGQNKSTSLSPSCNICIKVPSGISVTLNNIGGAVTISETLELLTVIGDVPCQIFTEALHNAVMRISKGVDVKVKRLLGRCDIVASKNAKVEVRYALISTLSATLRNTAEVNLYGNARFAKFDLGRGRRTHLHIDSIEELVGRKKLRNPNLSLGWVNSSRTTENEEQRQELIRQATAEMALFVQPVHDATRPPLAANA